MSHFRNANLLAWADWFIATQAGEANGELMVVLASLAAALLIQTTNAGPIVSNPAGPSNPPASNPPAAPATQAPQTSASARSDGCGGPIADSRVIVVCTQRPQGYRLNPDVMEAKREVRSAGRPTRPGGTVRPDCATVGPVPCFNAGINLLAAAATAAEMAKRLATGEEVGSMFVTDPHPSEYQLYLYAKARREADEKERVAKKARVNQGQEQGAPDAAMQPRPQQQAPQ
jgi:hypothetical protein